MTDTAPSAVPALDLDPFTPENLADPFSHHAGLRDAGPLIWLPALGCYAMARYGEVQAALMDWETFISGRGVGLTDFARETPWRPPSLLLEMDPPTHNRTRGIMKKIVTLAALREVMPEWREKADALVGSVAGKGPIDAIPDLAEALPLSIFPDMIGIREEGRENLIPYATVAFNAFGPRNALLAEAMEAAKDATEWVNESCKRDNLQPGGWGMQLYEAADRGECSADEAERLVRSFLTAGVDTTVNGIAGMIHAFAEFPQEWQRLRNDPSLAKKTVEEVLRWGGTVQIFFRTTSRPVAIEGYNIPEHSKILLFLASANRDPRRWDDPDRFDIGRQASGHVGFGFGIHQCLGQMVARLEMEAMLGALIPRVAEIRPAAPVVRRLNNTLHAIGSLPVELIAA